MTTATTTQTETLIATGLHSWEQSIRRATTFFDSCTDEDLGKEILPGKNRVIYLLGHLIAVHDRMLPLLGLGERLYPELDAPFVTNPDDPAAASDNPASGSDNSASGSGNSASGYPPAARLRKYWTTINEQLTAAFKSWTPAEWLQRHTAVSEEDFAKEPHRNRYGVVLNRAGHVQYHLGQLVWFKK